MKRTWKKTRKWLLSALALPPFMIGCYGVGDQHGCTTCGHGAGGHQTGPFKKIINKIDTCATVQPGSLPEPNGTFVRRFQQVQANLAEQDDFTIYLNEWREAKLTPYGSYHIHQMARRLADPDLRFPVVIQVSIDQNLDEDRRRVVIDRLAECGIHDAAARVQIGYPEAEGLDARESIRIELGYLFGGAFGNNGQGGFGGGGLGGLGNLGGLGGFGGFGGYGGFGGFGGNNNLGGSLGGYYP